MHRELSRDEERTFAGACSFAPHLDLRTRAILERLARDRGVDPLISRAARMMADAASDAEWGRWRGGDHSPSAHPAR